MEPTRPRARMSALPRLGNRLGTVGVGGNTSPHYCFGRPDRGIAVATHSATVSWKSDGQFASGRYSRVHELIFDGGTIVRGSSSPAVVPLPMSDPAGIDPEEALVASAAACHMLWFLALAREAGLEVESYRDDASAQLGRDDRGRLALTRISLRPAIAFTGREPEPEELERLHSEAHDRCFIANSLRGEVVVEPPAP